MKLKVRFVLAGFSENPNEITLALGIEPSRTWRAGDLIYTGPRRYPTNGWVISAESTTSDQKLDILLESVISKIRGVVDKIKTFRASDVELSVVVHLEDAQSAPAIRFPAELLKVLDHLQASIDIDIYP